MISNYECKSIAVFLNLLALVEPLKWFSCLELLHKNYISLISISCFYCSCAKQYTMRHESAMYRFPSLTSKGSFTLKPYMHCYIHSYV